MTDELTPPPKPPRSPAKRVAAKAPAKRAAKKTAPAVEEAPPAPPPPLPVAPPPPPQAEPPSSDEMTDPIQRLVAVLIIAVTLVGAVFAFLQTQAGNRETSAGREAQTASLRSMALLIQGSRQINQSEVAYDASTDHGWLRFSYDLETENPDENVGYAGVLGRVHLAAEEELAKNSAILQDEMYAPKTEGGLLDWSQFYEDRYRGSYASAEFEKAWGRERDGWSAKGSQYVTVITVFAVALFLLGLTLTVPGNARRPFLGMGTVVAIIAAIWGVTIFARSVQSPSPVAINAYVDGIVEENAAASVEEYETAVGHFTRAIGARDDYQEAYVGRSGAYFSLDFLNPDGPQGTEPARDDLERAVELNPDDYLAWGNLGAVEFWLGDYESAGAATDRALELRPKNPTIVLNKAIFLKLENSEEAYDAHMARTRELFVSLPELIRTFTLDRYQQVFDLGKKHRPEIADKVAEFEEDVLRMRHQIEVSLALNGDGTPPPVEATMGELEFDLEENDTKLLVSFDYEGMEDGQTWQYRTYVDGALDKDFTLEPEGWTFDVPDGGLILTFTRPEGFDAGTAVRTEIFVEGNLLTAGTFTSP